ncbi:MAG: type IV pilus assembly protein PilM [Patescibacteria group bacterium]|jgi:type IV pilus assembly protein PilM
MSIFGKKAFGLDISDTSIEALEIKKQLGKLAVSVYARKLLEPGVVENGRILNKQKLTAALKDLVGAGNFSQKNVVLSIPESKTFIHVFKMPGVISREHLGDSVMFQAEEVIPLAFDRAYHDYQIIEKTPEHQSVVFVAAFKETIDHFREALEVAGLNPVVFEPESVSLIRSLVHEDTPEGVALVDIGARTSIITIYDHRGIRYSENFPVAGQAITKKIMEALSVSEEEAGKLKRTVGLKSEKGKSLTIEPILDSIANEILKAIGYYRRQSGFIVNKVILCGGTSLLPGLLDYMQHKLSIKVELGDPLAPLNFDKNVITRENAVLFSAAIGLARRGFDIKSLDDGINLLPQEKERQASKPEKTMAVKTPGLSSRLSLPKVDKRTLILLAVFVFLILVFLAVLLISRTREEPLIPIVNNDYQTSSGSNIVE